MKTLIATIVVVFCFISCGNAQDYYKKGKITSEKEVYSCRTSDKGKWINLRNIKNKLFHEKQIIPSKTESLSEIDFQSTRKKIETIFNETISATDKANLKASKGLLSIAFWINDSGKILELDFDLYKNIAFKPQYLAKIEQRIKSEVIFPFSSNEYKDANFIRFSMVFNPTRMF